MDNIEKDFIDWNVKEIEPEKLINQEIEVSLWGEDWKTISSKEKISIIIRVEAEYRHFAGYGFGWRKRVQNYQEYKTRLAHGLIDEINILIPGLKKSILVMDIATPLTFEDQGGRSEGAVAGWSWDYEDFHEDDVQELILTPIRGLYMT